MRRREREHRRGRADLRDRRRRRAGGHASADPPPVRPARPRRARPHPGRIAPLLDCVTSSSCARSRACRPTASACPRSRASSSSRSASASCTCRVRDLEERVRTELENRPGARVFAAGATGSVVTLRQGTRVRRATEIVVWRPRLALESRAAAAASDDPDETPRRLIAVRGPDASDQRSGWLERWEGDLRGIEACFVVRGGWEGHQPVEATDLFLPFLARTATRCGSRSPGRLRRRRHDGGDRSDRAVRDDVDDRARRRSPGCARPSKRARASPAGTAESPTRTATRPTTCSSSAGSSRRTPASTRTS